jgi:hypothetical protein
MANSDLTGASSHRYDLPNAAARAAPPPQSRRLDIIFQLAREARAGVISTSWQHPTNASPSAYTRNSRTRRADRKNGAAEGIRTLDPHVGNPTCGAQGVDLTASPSAGVGRSPARPEWCFAHRFAHDFFRLPALSSRHGQPRNGDARRVRSAGRGHHGDLCQDRGHKASLRPFDLLNWLGGHGDYSIENLRFRCRCGSTSVKRFPQRAVPYDATTRPPPRATPQFE